MASSRHRKIYKEILLKISSESDQYNLRNPWYRFEKDGFEKTRLTC